MMALAILVLVTACVPPSGGSNPFRTGDVYSSLPHPERQHIRILDSGELHYDY